MSNRAGDTGNYEKLITDFATSPKYCSDKYVGENMVNINIDDRYIKELTVGQVPIAGDKWNIRITFLIATPQAPQLRTHIQ